jgi:anti-anti-sigma factor
MDDSTLRVSTRSSSSEGLVLAVEGYLDEKGGMALARETHTAHEVEQQRIRIDLGAVFLFNCSGARQLVTLIDELDKLGCEVDLVGVHPPLQRALHFTA